MIEPRISIGLAVAQLGPLEGQGGEDQKAVGGGWQMVQRVGWPIRALNASDKDLFPAYPQKEGFPLLQKKFFPYVRYTVEVPWPVPLPPW